MANAVLAAVALDASVVLLLASSARADDAAMGAPPADAKTLVAAPKASEEVPKISAPTNETNVTLSAGGLLSTGNSRLAAATANGKFSMRRGDNGFGASILANYGAGTTAPSTTLSETTENVQGRLRYDRYFGDNLSAFLMATGLHDRFLGLNFRLNIDPGVKYLFVNTAATAFWGEGGYDFQYDDRLDSALVETDPTTMVTTLLPKTATDHSVRLFVGLKHAFNKEVSLTTGFEYLQSVVASTRYRFNYDAIFAANVGGGLSLGLGFTARYDHDPLPGKVDLDTSTTVNLIYAFTDASKPGVPPPPPPPTCVPAAAPAGPAPGAAPSGSPPGSTAPASPAPSPPPPATTAPSTTAPGAAPPSSDAPSTSAPSTMVPPPAPSTSPPPSAP